MEALRQINNVSNCLKDIYSRTYADDTNISSHSSNLEPSGSNQIGETLILVKTELWSSALVRGYLRMHTTIL